MIASRPMPARRVPVAAMAALACAATALWTSFGALTFVAADIGADRVGLLPPLARLVAAIAVALAIGAIVRPSARQVAPLWLSAIIILPWLPIPLPLSTFVWTGPIRIAVWIAIATALIVPIAGPPEGGHYRGVSRNRSYAPPNAALLAGALAATAYGVGAWAVAPQHPVGDEPHYLVITQSLLRDHDLKIENNHRQGDYLAYFPNPLKPDYLRRGTDGQIYSIHAPGLPALIAPAFALGGYTGVVSALVALSAAAAALTWLVAWRVTRNRAASWFAWAAVTMSAPFFFHAPAIYPDALAATLLLVAILPLADERAREPWWLVLVGAALAMLPWLHTRFAILATSAAVVLVARLLTASSRRFLRLAALFACPIVSAIAWFAFFQTIYGTPNPAAPYGGATGSSLMNVVRGAPGLLFDQEFGLIANAPVYLCAVAGIVTMLGCGPRRLAVELIAIWTPYFLAVAAYQMWWGGLSAPARFLVPIALTLVVPTAIWFATRASTVARMAGAAALVASLLITSTICLVDRGALLLDARSGASRLAVWLSPAVNLTTALPSLFQNPPLRVTLHVAVWLLALVMTLLVAFVVSRGARSEATVLVASSVGFAVAVALAMSFIWRSNRSMPITAGPGGSALLRRFDPDTRQIALAYRPFRRVPLADLPNRITLLSSPGVVDHLPAGIYEASAVIADSSGGRIRIAVDRQSPPVEDWTIRADERLWKRQFVLPVDVWQLRVEADSQTRARLREISLRARALPGRSQRLDTDVEAARGARYGRAVVFRVAGGTYFEAAGFWVLGRSLAEFAIGADGQSVVRLFVRNSATDNEVSLQAGSWTQKLGLKSREEQLVDVPLDVHRLGTLLKVETSNGARPADVDPRSDDQRLLGCWLEVR